MNKYSFVAVFFLSAIFVFISTIDAIAQDKEIESIVKEVSVDSQKGAIFSYTYLMKFSYNNHKGLIGRKFTRLYEAIIPSRFSLNRIYSHPFVLIEDSERKITNEEIMHVRKAIAKEIEKTENEPEPAVDNVKTIEDGGYWTIGFSNNGKKIKVNILEILKKSRLSNLQRRQIDGRSMISIDFKPDPSAVFEKPLAYLSKLEGQFLIDEADKRIIRVEGFAPEMFAAVKDKPEAERQKETIFLFSQTKVAEGFWFPLAARLNFSRHADIFEPVEIEYSFSNYRKASVDVKDQVEAPKTTETETVKQ